MLLGRCWIHFTRAIPSSLHQNIKYVIDGKLVTISTRESSLVTKDPSVSYIEANEKALEALFQSFEIVVTGYVAERALIPCLMISEAS